MGRKIKNGSIQLFCIIIVFIITIPMLCACGDNIGSTTSKEESKISNTASFASESVNNTTSTFSETAYVMDKNIFIDYSWHREEHYKSTAFVLCRASNAEPQLGVLYNTSSPFSGTAKDAFETLNNGKIFVDLKADTNAYFEMINQDKYII